MSRRRRTSAAIWYERYKPAASCRVHLLAAACMWTTVGLALATFGSARMLRQAGASGAGFLSIAIVVLAVVAGIVKGRWLLSRTARRNVERIRRRGEGRCIGGFLSPRSWALVALMVLLGRTLRHHRTLAPIVGPIYLAVGVALLVGSAQIWRARSGQRAC